MVQILASFASHTLDRGFENLIAKQLVTLHKDYGWGDNCSVVDIMLGGGQRHFDSFGFNETTAADYGYTYFTDNTTLYTLCEDDLPAIGLFTMDDMAFYLDLINTDNDLPSLLDMTRMSVELLNKSYYEEGFFLMVEGSRIDICGHANDIACIMHEMNQFMDAVQYVMDWAEADNDTLVVVLADHETGGMTIGRQELSQLPISYMLVSCTYDI